MTIINTSKYYLLQLTTITEELETVFGLIFVIVKSLFLFRGGLLFQDGDRTTSNPGHAIACKGTVL